MNDKNPWVKFEIHASTAKCKLLFFTIILSDMLLLVEVLVTSTHVFENEASLMSCAAHSCGMHLQCKYIEIYGERGGGFSLNYNS